MRYCELNPRPRPLNPETLNQTYTLKFLNRVAFTHDLMKSKRGSNRFRIRVYVWVASSECNGLGLRAMGFRI